MKKESGLKLRIEKLPKNSKSTAMYIQLVSMEESNKFLTNKEIRNYLDSRYSYDELERLSKQKIDSLFIGFFIIM
jgi:hypothetical protein